MVSVDTRPVPLQFALRDRHWIGVAQLESSVVALLARSFRYEDLELVTTEVEPYLAAHPVLS